MRRSERLRVTLEKYGFGFRAVGVTLTIVAILVVIGLLVLIFKGVGGDIMNVFGKMFGDDTKQEEDMDYVSIEEVEARLFEIGELSTALYDYEGVITESDCDELFDYDLPWTRYFVELEYEGEIRAGYEIKDIDVTVDDDEMIIYIELPEPEVFSNEITDRDLEWSDGLFNEVDPDIEIELTEEVKEEELEAAYRGLITALLREGVDLLLIESITDVRNAEIAATICRELSPETPIIFSAVLSKIGGLLISGRTIEKYVEDVEKFSPLAIGFNCSTGVKSVVDNLSLLARYTSRPIYCSPSAGIPDGKGRYPESVKRHTETLRAAAESGLLSIVGGCCGTTEEYTRAVAQMARHYKPRK